MENEITRETATSTICGIAKQLSDYLAQSVEYIKKEAPQVAREVVKWAIVSSIILAITHLVMTIIGLWLLLQTIGWTNSPILDTSHFESTDWSIWQVVRVVGGFITSGIMVCYNGSNCVNQIVDLTKALTAPRLVIIAYLKRLTN